MTMNMALAGLMQGTINVESITIDKPAMRLVRAAAQAHCTSICLSQRLPKRIRPVRRLPADSWLPGHKPAQLAR